MHLKVDRAMLVANGSCERQSKWFETWPPPARMDRLLLGFGALHKLSTVIGWHLHSPLHTPQDKRLISTANITMPSCMGLKGCL